MKFLYTLTLFFALFVLSRLLFAQEAPMPVNTKMPQIVAHRGASHLAPENTLAAFKLAFELGADAIEGDFRLTKDKQVVCIHDDTTKKTGSKNLNVHKSTFAQLQQVDVGSWKGQQWKNERIPTLQSVLEIVPAGKRLLLEIKDGPSIVPYIKKELAKSNLKTDQVTIISFDQKVVLACKKQLPNYKTFWLVSFKKNMVTQKWKPSKASVLKTLDELKADGLDCKAEKKVVDVPFVQSLRKANLEFHVWTVNDEEKAKHFQNLGVDSITTDRPAFLRKALAD